MVTVESLMENEMASVPQVDFNRILGIPTAPVTKIMGPRLYVPYSYTAQQAHYLGNWEPQGILQASSAFAFGSRYSSAVDGGNLATPYTAPTVAITVH